MWGREERNLRCRSYVNEYIKIIEDIIKDGIKKGEIYDGDPEAIATAIFGLTCSILMYKLETTEEINIQNLYNVFSQYAIKGLKIK